MEIEFATVTNALVVTLTEGEAATFALAFATAVMTAGPLIPPEAVEVMRQYCEKAANAMRDNSSGEFGDTFWQDTGEFFE